MWKKTADVCVWCAGKLCVSNLLTLSSGFDVLWVGESLCCCTCVVLRSVPFTRYHLHPPHSAFTSQHSVSITAQCGVISALNVWESVWFVLFILGQKVLWMFCVSGDCVIICNHFILCAFSDDISFLYKCLFRLSSCTRLHLHRTKCSFALHIGPNFKESLIKAKFSNHYQSLWMSRQNFIMFRRYR